MHVEINEEEDIAPPADPVFKPNWTAQQISINSEHQLSLASGLLIEP